MSVWFLGMEGIQTQSSMSYLDLERGGQVGVVAREGRIVLCLFLRFVLVAIWEAWSHIKNLGLYTCLALAATSHFFPATSFLYNSFPIVSCQHLQHLSCPCENLAASCHCPNWKWHRTVEQGTHIEALTNAQASAFWPEALMEVEASL